MKVIDEKGKTYGCLTVLERDFTRGPGAYWICRCKCGNVKSVKGNSLRKNENLRCKKCINNKYSFVDNCAIGEMNDGSKFCIDLIDYEIVSKYNWNLGLRGYAKNKKLGSMHRFLINPPTDMVVDHIDGNKLNNKRSNLRVCTRADNSANRVNVKGYSKVPSGMYQARICYKGKNMYLGSFDTEKKARKAYEKAAKKLFGEFFREQ